MNFTFGVGGLEWGARARVAVVHEAFSLVAIVRKAGAVGAPVIAVGPALLPRPHAYFRSAVRATLAPALLAPNVAQRPPALPVRVGEAAPARPVVAAWEKHALSARGFKRVGRHSEHAI